MPQSRSRSESGFPTGLDEISLSENNFRSTTDDTEKEDEELRTVSITPKMLLRHYYTIQQYLILNPNFGTCVCSSH